MLNLKLHHLTSKMSSYSLITFQTFLAESWLHFCNHSYSRFLVFELNKFYFKIQKFCPPGNICSTSLRRIWFYLNVIFFDWLSGECDHNECKRLLKLLTKYTLKYNNDCSKRKILYIKSSDLKTDVNVSESLRRFSLITFVR